MHKLKKEEKSGGKLKTNISLFIVHASVRYRVKSLKHKVGIPSQVFNESVVRVHHLLVPNKRGP